MSDGGDEELQQVDGDGPGDEEEKEGDAAVGDDLPAIDEAEEALGDGGVMARKRHSTSV